MRKPISENEMILLVEEEIARLDNLTRPTWKKYRVQLHSVRVDGGGGERESFYVVAKHDREVVFYDDAQEQFGSGEIDASGSLHPRSLYGAELRQTLRHFPKHQPRGDE